MKVLKNLSIALFAAAIFASPCLYAQDSDESMEDGMEMEETEQIQTTNIVEFASQSSDHTTLVAALKAAGLVETLSGAGPFTVFAPTNAAFDALPAGTVETLLKPENKEALSGILAYHVIAGQVSAAQVISLIEQNNGRATVATVAGGTVTFYLNDGNVYLEDENGNAAAVTVADLDQSNGVIHVIDAVLMPENK